MLYNIGESRSCAFTVISLDIRSCTSFSINNSGLSAKLEHTKSICCLESTLFYILKILRQKHWTLFTKIFSWNDENIFLFITHVCSNRTRNVRPLKSSIKFASFSFFLYFFSPILIFHYWLQFLYFSLVESDSKKMWLCNLRIEPSFSLSSPGN